MSNSEIEDLKQKLAEKEKELEELRKTFKEYKEISDSLSEQIKLKDNQINTISTTIKTKDDLIKTIQDSIELKNSQIDVLQKTVETKNKTINDLSQQLDSTINESVSKENDKKIAELENELGKLNEELATTDDEIERLSNELENMQSKASITKDLFIDFTDIEINRDEIIKKMKEILLNALHSVSISSPSISDLQDLDLYEVKSSVNMRISCLIDPSVEEHIDLLEEFESLDNVNIRSYESEDRWLIFRDREELFFCAVGTKPNNYLAFYTKDSAHITLFNSLITETWLRSRKI